MAAVRHPDMGWKYEMKHIYTHFQSFKTLDLQNNLKELTIHDWWPSVYFLCTLLLKSESNRSQEDEATVGLRKHSLADILKHRKWKLESENGLLMSDILPTFCWKSKFQIYSSSQSNDGVNTNSVGGLWLESRLVHNSQAFKWQNLKASN